ncbi:MAG: hypothetical protein KatS3mg003_1936 [Candidatus Nitrosocaldaceae archaeon]|nr:MAG: hypothetical protein KatS3mg003_1936 [Candidatus Nitrosocaldaceae archaeon]
MEGSKSDYILMEYSILSKGEISIVYCNICNEKHIVDKKIEEWYKEHIIKHRYIPNYKGDKRRVYCLICKESCYPSLNGKIPESKEEFDLWYNKHSSLFHKNEELISIDTSKIEEKKENAIEKLYKCDICNALYREKSNIEKHLKYLHKIEARNIEPIEIDFQDNERRSNGNKFGMVTDKKSRKSIVSLVREGDSIVCKHCNKRHNNMLKLAEHIKEFSNTNAEDWVIEGGRDLLSFLF